MIEEQRTGSSHHHLHYRGVSDDEVYGALLTKADGVKVRADLIVIGGS